MSRLLLDPNLSSFERDLLRSWDQEQPSAAARERAMTLAAVAGGTALAAGASVAPKAISATWIAIVKWLVISTVIATAGVGGTIYLLRDQTPTVAPAAAPPAPIASSQVPSVPASALPEAPPAPSAPASVVRPRETKAAAPSLAEQIEAIDRARAAVAAGDGVRGAQLADEYDRRFPRGAFAEEAEVLRIEARMLRGDKTGARRAAERFLASHPGSPHGPRLRALAGSTDP
jgi:hypothetical protein